MRAIAIAAVLAGGAGVALWLWLGGDDGSSSADLSTEAVRDIQAQVERIRGLEASRPIDVELLSDRVLEDRIERLLSTKKVRRLADLETRVLETLGAVPRGTDLFELELGAVSEQVAGLYNPKSDRLLVRSSGELGPLERIVLAHELTHAVVDQHFDLRELSRPRASRYDSAIAETSVAEGDAELVTERYAATELGLGDLLSLLGEAGSLEVERFRQLPYYLRREFIFPYTSGLSFVRGLYRVGGWRKVNRAYERPPAASDQILFPSRYGRTPARPPRLSGPGDRWSSGFRMQFGAAPLLWLFRAPGDQTARAVPDPIYGVSAWRGGQLSVWRRGSKTALGMGLLEPPQSKVLCAQVAAWYTAAFPDGKPRPLLDGERIALDGSSQDAALRCPPRQVLLGIAPSLRLARRSLRLAG